MLYNFINSFCNIIFIIDVVMSCDVISDSTCITYFLCKIPVVSGMKCIIILGYIVCTIRIIITCFV